MKKITLSKTKAAFSIVILSIVLAACGGSGGGSSPSSRVDTGNGSKKLSNVLFVNENSKASSPNGSSWENAYKDLSEALKSAKEKNDNQVGSITQIWIAKGTYTPSLAGVVAGSGRKRYFTLLEGVKIYGGFSGTGTETKVTERDPVNNIVILSGDFNGNDFGDFKSGSRAENAYHVIYTKGLNDTAQLHGVTIKGGNAYDSNNNNDDKGGGIYNSGGNPTFTNVTIDNNFANNGAGVYNETSNAIFSNVTISDNKIHSGEGGGVYNNGGNPKFINTTISNNVGDTGSKGGGVYNDGSNPKFTNITINSNVANFGAAIYNNNSEAIFINTTISSNTASTNGGGILNDGGNTTFINATIFHNKSNGGNGGGIYAKSGTIAIINTIMWKNQIGFIDSDLDKKPSAAIEKEGGDIYIAYSTIQNSKISGDNVIDKADNSIIGTNRGSVFSYELKGSITTSLTNSGGAVQTIIITTTSPAVGVGAYVKLCGSSYCFAKSEDSATWTDITTGQPPKTGDEPNGSILNSTDARGYKLLDTALEGKTSPVAMGAYNPYATMPAP